MNYRFHIIITICFIFIWDSYGQKIKSTSEKIIKIGLLISDKRSVAAQNGAALAIDKVNEKESSDGLRFQLVVRSMEGPWGTGSKEAVNLVFKENVWAIMGSHDGRNAHLVEQVIAKTHIVFLSAWASDPTLYQAFVPWFFSCVPNDLQQADALIKEIVQKRKWSKIATVSDNSYDSKLALQSFLKQIKITDKIETVQLFYDSTNKNFGELFDKINENDTDCIILFGQPITSLTFVQQLRKNRMNHPVFGTFSLLAEDRYTDEELAQYNDVSFVTYKNRFNEENLSFVKIYKEKHGKSPGVVAAYAYDGMNLIIEAIKHSGLDREKIQEAMSNIRYKGVTGLIQFDEKGNRIDAVELIEIKKRIPITVEK